MPVKVTDSRVLVGDAPVGAVAKGDVESIVMRFYLRGELLFLKDEAK